MNSINYRIDNLQYCNWSEEIFKINRKAKLDAIHVTIAYHENFDEVLKNLEKWSEYFKEFRDLVTQDEFYISMRKEWRDKERHLTI